MLDAKLEHREVVAAEPPPRKGAEVIDLMEALRRSVGGGAREAPPGAARDAPPGGRTPLTPWHAPEPDRCGDTGPSGISASPPSRAGARRRKPARAT